MIDEIQVKDLALIAQATLEPCAGLTVLTGETGAGKTALLSALKLLMGERADKTLIRDGKNELYVAGRFVGGAAEGADEEAETIAVRRVLADGRNKVTLNGEMAGVAELTGAIGPRIDLCSQHENQQLTKVAAHVDMLDAWAGAAAEGALAAYRTAYDEAAAAAAALKEIMDAAKASGSRLEEARFILRRINEVNPKEGEYEELLAELSRAEHAETLALAADTAYSVLTGSEDGSREGAADALARAISALEAAASLDAALGEMASSLRDAQALAQDAAMSARAYRDGLEFDAESLAERQSRVAAMQGLLRAYGPRMRDVFAARDAAADLVSMVDDADLRLEEARAAVAAAEVKLAVAADALGEVRRSAAEGFAAQVVAQMRRLDMGSAEILCQVEPLPREKWTRVGAESVEFMFRSGAGLAARPLARIASGGEISRVMLAMKVVLGNKDGVDTLVFDEIDAGVGGATALALAEVIADLAKTHQVIVVTHLAQVAAKAQKHYLVSKTEGDRPQTQLTVIDDDARVTEIARMLGGTATEASLAHARELLAAALG